MNTIAIIDGNSLMHRAFHAVPPYMKAPDGRPTNACFGFLSMLLKLVDDFKPDGIVCAFDHGVPAFRFDAIEKYKAQRLPTAPDLKAQFPIIKQILTSLGIPVVESEGWEGDDILGTLSATGEREGMKVLLITGDKDALQLASEHTSIVNTKTGMSDVVVYGPEGVVERWGVTPERVPDFLGLMGDSSDNIPGVPGVGPKTATRLLQVYGTLEEVLAHVDEIKGKLGENVRNNMAQARASKVVATISCDVPLDCNLAQVRFPAYDAQEVTATFHEFALNSHLKKVLALIGKQDSAPRGSRVLAALEDESLEFRVPLRGADALCALEEALAQGKREKGGALDVEAVPDAGGAVVAAAPDAAAPDDQLALFLEARTGDSLFDNDRLLYVASRDHTMLFEGDEVDPVCARVIKQGRIVVLDSKTLLQELVPADAALPALIGPDDVSPAHVFDLSLAAYLLDSTHDTQSELLVEHYISDGIPEPTEELPRGAIHVAVFRKLGAILRQRLIEDGSLECFTRIEMPLVPVLVWMERWGVNVDTDLLTTLAASIGEDVVRLRAQALAEAGEDFNLDSPKQVGAILFEKLGLPPVKKTRTGYSTDAAVLQEIKGLHPLPGIMLEYRELSKLKSTYLDALPHLIGGDRHIHTSYNQTVAATGRLSSSEPNLQNIPVRTELGRRIRAAFIPDPSCFGGDEAVFLAADYSQIELRLLAHLSGDEGLIEAFVEGEDFHASTAARLFGVPADEVTPQLRSRAKAVNFGIVYGQQAYGLAQSLGVSFQEAHDMITRYFAAYPQVRRYLDETVEQAREKGWVQTLYGRKRHIREIYSGNSNMRSFGERTAMNHPMQGSAADIIKLAMIEVARRLEAEGLRSQMVLQVHDELDFNCAKDELEQMSVLVKEVMEGVADLKAPLVVDVGHGPDWSKAH
ncbi:MAG: DNA polymerase I [Coriobacteriales bacterium]|jgi:DNA polymerase-1|nr:DNA polymerase I [Coriobacteriales bacterium]